MSEPAFFDAPGPPLGPASGGPPPTPQGLDRVALALAEWFGCGRSPIAPGTVGSFGALPLYWALAHLGPLAYALSTLTLSAVGIWASERASVVLDDKDPSRVVIDEVTGVLIALGFVLEGPLWALAISFASFRLLDILKPGPIFKVQFLKPAGFGIMADDLLAGVIAGVVGRALLYASAGISIP